MGPKWLFFPTSPLLLLGYESQDQWVHNGQLTLAEVVVALLMIFKAHMNIFIIVKVTILMLIKWSYRSPNYVDYWA